jgi:hypothetical protein
LLSARRANSLIRSLKTVFGFVISRSFPKLPIRIIRMNIIK